MIKGLAITPPVIGRISIGKVVERNGKRVPEKDDAFTITTLVQNRDGWLIHPLQAKLLERSGKEPTAKESSEKEHAGKEQPAREKLRAIPVTVLFNASDLNLRAAYSCFDRESGRPICVGNGESAKGITAEGIKTYPCPSPEACELGRKGGCKPYGRLNVQIEGQDDVFASFIFRTTGFNSIRTLSARLTYFEAVSGGLTRYLPLMLKLRGKSTTQSHRTPIYFVDLCLREGVTLAEAIATARELAARDREAGVDIGQLEQAARMAIGNGLFEESEDEGPAIVEEFFTETGDVQPSDVNKADVSDGLTDTPRDSGDGLDATRSLEVRLQRKVDGNRRV